MGLGGPRKRAKISQDPNNTTWSRATKNYGHQMLLSQGWTPGTNLGAANAPHAHLHSDASASHIRVAIRSDNLGLGAKIGSGVMAGECTGLDVFQSLLGRLNGKAEGVLEKEQKSRDDLKRALYTEKRWGTLRFVSGGVLVGDKIQDFIDAEKERVAQRSNALALENPSSEEPGSTSTKSRSRRRNTSKRATMELPDQVVDNAENYESLLLLRERKRGFEALTSIPASSDDTDTAKKTTEKAQRKLDRRKAKNLKRLARADNAIAEEPENGLMASPSTTATDSPMAGTLTPAFAPSVPNPRPILSGRHAVRQRYIMQKKMALMDPKALNEILMIKT